MLSLKAFTAILLTALIVAFLLTITLSTLSDQEDVNINGEVKGINVRLSLTAFSFEHPLGLGESVPIDLVVYNDGNIPMTLSMFTGNYTPPEAEMYIHVTWDSEGVVVDAGQNVAATITVTADANTPSSIVAFSMKSTIVGTE